MNELDKIGSLLVDRNINNVDLEGDDEQFGALMMLGYLQNKIYPILEQLREENKWKNQY